MVVIWFSSSSMIQTKMVRSIVGSIWMHERFINWNSILMRNIRQNICTNKNNYCRIHFILCLNKQKVKCNEHTFPRPLYVFKTLHVER